MTGKFIKVLKQLLKKKNTIDMDYKRISKIYESCNTRKDYKTKRP